MIWSTHDCRAFFALGRKHGTIHHMMTWQLWRALKNPPQDHPLYRRLLARVPTSDWRQFITSFAGPVASMCLPWLICCGLMSTPIGAGLLGLVLLLLTLNGSYY